MKVTMKSTLREIKNSVGRYLAILIIIALGVGFFAGLRACRPALAGTAGRYFDEQKLYDFNLLSSIGFSKDSVDSFLEMENVENAKGALYEDVLIEDGKDNRVFRIHSITDSVNKPKIVSGRLPESDDECLVDAACFGEDIIGKTLSFSENNPDETKEAFNRLEFTVVGIAKSPLYISNERGTTNLGDGKITGFIFADESVFTADYFKEIYVTLTNNTGAYSGAYNRLISDAEPAMTSAAESAANLRYEKIVSDAQKEVDDAKEELDKADAEIKEKREEALEEAVSQITAMGLPATPDSPIYEQALEEIDAAFADTEKELAENYDKLAEAQKDVDSIKKPTVYVLKRSENAGYTAFKQDSTIIENISVVFPAFFFLVAALVCVTTMTRMVDEQRTQIGVWKALGYNKWKISFKYLFYAGSAGLIGNITGFFLGTVFMPKIFWLAYKTIYNFADNLIFTFDGVMYVLSFVISIICTAGAAFLCCRKVLHEVPALILRPKAPKNGKRIFLERFRIWQHVKFLHKVSLRNVIRYKQRFFLMILGIGGCSALLLTGFGIRDSIQNVTAYQYGQIVLFDAKLTFTDSIEKNSMEDFSEKNDLESVLFLSEINADITSEDGVKNTQITAVLGDDLEDFMMLKNDGETLAYPQDGEILLSKGIADKLRVKAGETVTLTDDSFRQITLYVSNIFDNYVDNYVFITKKTMLEFCGESPANAAYIHFNEDSGNDIVAKLLGNSDISHVELNSDTKKTIETSFESLNFVVVLIILCAGILAFIVLFNLININIGERIREIATIKVLGFFGSESAAYVFREVNMLTFAGALLGLVIGKLLHAFVMTQIRPDGMCFDSRILPASYFLSLAVTAVFALLVRLAMHHKLKKIGMAESLKSVE